LPSSNSLNQEESRTVGHGAAVTAEALEKWKEEILCELKQEINKTKNEIIEALRSEFCLQRSCLNAEVIREVLVSNVSLHNFHCALTCIPGSYMYKICASDEGIVVNESDEK
ncbi:hypothetical protein WUBG_15195, partial [Wuchereria bancrofti]